MNLKKYLPIEDYIITSKLSVEEVKSRLADNIEPKKGLRLPISKRDSYKPYEGQITGESFTISRIINYRNSFLPVITGQLSTFLGKTEIKVKMKPVTLVIVFMSIWLGTVGFACVGIILVGLFQFKQLLQNGFSPMLLVPFGMFLFGWLLTTLSFKSESKKSKEFLNQIFEAEVSF